MIGFGGGGGTTPKTPKPRTHRYNVGVYIDAKTEMQVNAKYKGNVIYRKCYKGVVLFVPFRDINAAAVPPACPMKPLVVISPALLGKQGAIGARLTRCPDMPQEELDRLIKEGVRFLSKLSILSDLTLRYEDTSGSGSGGGGSY